MNHPPVPPAPVPEKVDVYAIRLAHGRMFGTRMTQKAFAHLYGFAPATVRDWEQGRYAPDRTARALLTVIQHEAPAVRRALRAARPSAASADHVPTAGA